jgi:hypothetical protein
VIAGGWRDEWMAVDDGLTPRENCHQQLVRHQQRSSLLGGSWSLCSPGSPTLLLLHRRWARRRGCLCLFLLRRLLMQICGPSCCSCVPLGPRIWWSRGRCICRIVRVEDQVCGSALWCRSLRCVGRGQRV